jgi:hypothetical protein
VRCKIAALDKPDDGEPAELFPFKARNHMKPCMAGIGTRGGKSRGKGSGSRLRKFQCSCGQIVRASCDELPALHLPCGTGFQRA